MAYRLSNDYLVPIKSVELTDDEYYAHVEDMAAKFINKNKIVGFIQSLIDPDNVADILNGLETTRSNLADLIDDIDSNAIPSFFIDKIKSDLDKLSTLIGETDDAVEEAIASKAFKIGIFGNRSEADEKKDKRWRRKLLRTINLMVSIVVFFVFFFNVFADRLQRSEKPMRNFMKLQAQLESDIKLRRMPLEAQSDDLRNSDIANQILMNFSMKDAPILKKRLDSVITQMTEIVKTLKGNVFKRQSDLEEAITSSALSSISFSKDLLGELQDGMPGEIRDWVQFIDSLDDFSILVESYLNKLDRISNQDIQRYVDRTVARYVL